MGNGSVGRLHHNQLHLFKYASQGRMSKNIKSSPLLPTFPILYYIIIHYAWIILLSVSLPNLAMKALKHFLIILIIIWHWWVAYPHQLYQDFNVGYSLLWVIFRCNKCVTIVFNTCHFLLKILMPTEQSLLQFTWWFSLHTHIILS